MADQALVPAKRLRRKIDAGRLGVPDNPATLRLPAGLGRALAEDMDPFIGQARVQERTRQRSPHLRRLRGYANLQGSFSAAHNGKTMVAKPVG